MAIPLIQNVEKQDINTSIIAIRRQLEQLYNALGVTENTVVTNNIGGSDNTPLGTIVSYLGTENPANGEWLICDGSTFDASQYPSLATFLGGNVLPEVLDHSRPSDYERFTFTTVNQTVLYDGEFSVSNKGARTYYVNDIAVTYDISGNSSYNDSGFFTVKKGDVVRVNNIDSVLTAYVRWYKKYKLIKAVAPTDQYTPPSTEMQQIEQYVDNGLQRNMSYSTTEQWTGGYWIDGKKIYRKVIQGTFATTGGTTVNIGANLDVIHIGGFIQYGNARIEITASGGSSPCVWYRYLKNTGALERTVQGTFDSSSPVYIIVEYTKTTD